MNLPRGDGRAAEYSVSTAQAEMEAEGLWKMSSNVLSVEMAMSRKGYKGRPVRLGSHKDRGTSVIRPRG